jgi:hypothetical protein
MAKYIVSYDLRKPEKDYPDLIAHLQRIGGLRVLLSVWLVKSQSDHGGLRDQIKTNGKMDDNDRLLVAGLDGRAAWLKLLANDQAVLDWFNSP